MSNTGTLDNTDFCFRHTLTSSVLNRKQLEKIFKLSFQVQSERSTVVTQTRRVRCSDAQVEIFWMLVTVAHVNMWDWLERVLWFVWFMIFKVWQIQKSQESILTGSLVNTNERHKDRRRTTEQKNSFRWYSMRNCVYEKFRARQWIQNPSSWLERLRCWEATVLTASETSRRGFRTIECTPRTLARSTLALDGPGLAPAFEFEMSSKLTDA